MQILLKDIPQLSKRRFTHENHCTQHGYPGPCHFDTATGRLRVEYGWHITGWCASPPDELCPGFRKGQITMMFFHAENGEMWQHYPLYDEDERDAAVLDCPEPLIPKPKKRRKEPTDA